MAGSGASRIIDPFDEGGPFFVPGGTPQTYGARNREPDPVQGPPAPLPQPVPSRVVDPFDAPGNASPFRAGAGGDGSVLTMPTPGVVPYDPNDPNADRFSGGEAGVGTTLAASMVPQTSPENLAKRLRIFSQGMGIPEDRFFYDRQGNVAYVGKDGAVHLAVPTMGGGSWSNPVDMLRRTGAQVGDQFGPSLPAIAAAPVGMVFGPVAASATASAVDAGRQIVGNWFAGDQDPTGNLDFSNMAWQGLGAGTGELVGNVGSAVVNRLTTKNPYNLPAGEVSQLRQRMPVARERANALNQQGMWATPYDLTDLPFLQRLETTVNKQPGVAGDIMKDYYAQRSEVNFPGGVARLLDRISPEGVPGVGFEKLKEGAEKTIAHIRNTQVDAGMRGGWGEAIASGARVDPRPLVAHIRAVMPHVNGEVQAQLTKVLNNLYDGTRGPGSGSLVTDFEKLHNVRLDLEATLAKLTADTPPAERGRMLQYLKPIEDMLQTSLERAHPRYGAGTAEYMLRGAQASELRNGLLTLMSKDPQVGTKMGDVLFNADPKTVEAAKKLFEQAGQMDAWDAGSRAFLESALTSSRGPRVSSSFAGRAAPHQTHRETLDAILPEGARGPVKQVLDVGAAQGRVPHPANRAEVESIRLDKEKIPGSTVGEAIKGLFGPLRFGREIGGAVVERAMDVNAVKMALNLTGARQPRRGPVDWIRGRQKPPPTGPSTAQVLQNLEDTTMPFGGWQRHLLERALAAGTMGAIGQGRVTGLLGPLPEETVPYAPDLMRVPGLLGPRRTP